MLGGTHDRGAAVAPTVADIRGVLDRCTRLVPALATAQVTDFWAGLRPERAGGARIELEWRPTGRVWVHNYGHGGAGMTVHWGSADVAAKLVTAALHRFSKL